MKNVAQFGFHDLSGQDLARLEKKSFPWWSLLLVAALGVAVVCVFLRLWVGLAAAAVLLIAAAAIPLAMQSSRKRICHSYGAANEQQLREKWLKYRQALEQREAQKAARREAAEALERAKAHFGAEAERLEHLRGKTRIFDPNELRKMRVEWGIFEARANETDASLQEEALLNGRSRAELEQLAVGAVLQEETASQVRQLLEREQQTNRSLRDRREALDPRELEALWHRQTEQKAKNKVLKNEILEDEAQLAAVQTALGWLKESNQEMNTRFAPQLCTLAGEHLARLTGGKYRSLLMDAAFGIALETAEGTYPLERFSAGTRDAVYFAFRLAVSSLLSKEVLPMVLDDPFVNLDPQRLREAERLLSVAGENRQILYFKCR
ncbi:MAG: DUF3093 family protein [Oscillospiraceae bacterium]|nr:DUF3093 family protein [Oscillospiraceae bacterium]